MSDESAIVTALQSGQLDMAQVTGADAEILSRNFTIYSNPQNMVCLFAVNNAIEPFNNNKSYKGIFAIQINNSIVDMLNSERKYRFTIENNKGYLEQLEPIYVSPIELKKN